MASDTEDSSAVASDNNSVDCDTVSPEIISSKSSPRMSAAFGSYLSKAIAKGSRSFYGTDIEASDDDSVCEAEMIGKAAHALSEDINKKIRREVSSRSPVPSEHEPAAEVPVISEVKEKPVRADVKPTSDAKVDQASNSQPESEERAAQTVTSVERSMPEKKVADTATQSTESEPSSDAPAKADDSETDRPAADPDLLKDRERQLEERVRLLKERKSSARKSSSNPSGPLVEQVKVPSGSFVEEPKNPRKSSVEQPKIPSGSSVEQPKNPSRSFTEQPKNRSESFVEQLKKIDLSVDGGALKICDRNLSDNGAFFPSITSSLGQCFP